MYSIIGGVKVVSHPHLKKGRGIQIEGRDELHFHPHDYCLVLLNTSSDYSHVFKTMGVINDAIDACVVFAKNKINKEIDSYGE